MQRYLDNGLPSEPLTSSDVPEASDFPAETSVSADESDLSRELRRLQAVIVAQRWDIGGLTEQRDTAQATARQVGADFAVLTAQLDAERLELADLARRHDASQELTGLSEAALDGLLNATFSPVGRQAVERALIVAYGMFDEDYYRTVNPLPPGLTDPLGHYLVEGERRGFAPNPLFDPDYYRMGLAERDEIVGSALVHYLLRGWQLGLAPHPLFDPDFYRAQYQPPDGFAPLLHFVRIGARLGASPHPLFEPEYYRRRRGVESENSLALLRDFLAVGWRRGLSPHPLFDPILYLMKNPDVQATKTNPLIHYVLYGGREGRVPHALFDPEFYLRQLTSIGEADSPPSVMHYLGHGSRLGLSPHPLFDDNFYYDSNPDVCESGVIALTHFVDFGGAEGRHPHPTFDVSYLQRTYPEIFGQEPDPVGRFMSDPRCRNLSPTVAFDAEYYMDRYPEVRGSEVGAYLHFLQWGAQEGRDPHPLFDVAYYDRQVGGWRRRSHDPLSDFIRYSGREGTRPHPLFDPVWYLERNSDVRNDGKNAFLHYLEFGGGTTERRSPHPLFDASRYIRLGGRVVRNRTLLEAFLATPVDQLIDPHPLFSFRYYLVQRPDLTVRGINPLLHYVSERPHGSTDPHPLFSQDYYLQQWSDRGSIDVCLLEHFCTIGFAIPLSPHPAFDSAYVLEQNPAMRRSATNPLIHYLETQPLAQYSPNHWFDGVSYNLVHQGGRAGAANPLLDLIEHVGPSALPAPITPPPASLALPTGDRAAAPGDDLAQPQSATPSGNLDAFLATQDIRSAGELPPAHLANGSGVAIYAIYTASPNLSPFHRQMLGVLRARGYVLILVNSSFAGAEEFRSEALSLADLVIQRQGGGRDFASWIAAIMLHYQAIRRYDHVLFVNDSLLGPITSLDPVWQAFAASDAPVWGLTESLEGRRHIQSSFFIIRRPVLESVAFVSFCNGYSFPDERYEVVQQGEIGLAGALWSSGIAMQAMVSYRDLAAAWFNSLLERQRWHDMLAGGDASASVSEQVPAGTEEFFATFAEQWTRQTSTSLRRGEPLNPQHVFWDLLCQRFQYPFVKRDLLLVNPLKVPSVVRLPEILPGAARRGMLSGLARVAPLRTPFTRSVFRIDRESALAWSAEDEALA